MNQWSYVAAAYAVTILATLSLLGHTVVTMRHAERAVDDLRRG